MDNVLSNNIDLRVHIASVGFEIDRIVLPAIEMKADRVWLLLNKPESKERVYAKSIKKTLEGKNIDVKEKTVERLDPYSILRAFNYIIEEEKENNLFINVSTGSKIQSIAGMMACMMRPQFRITPYYAEPERYEPEKPSEQVSYGLKRCLKLPVFEIHTPKKSLLAALNIIKNEKDEKITKKKMVDLAKENNLISLQSKKNSAIALYSSLDKNIIQPLLNDWKFIKVEQVGRNRIIRLTERGREATEFLI